MKDAIEMIISGIKCDTCDYRDDSVKVEDYDDWLNKPCPKCGANLLTEDDYNNVQMIIKTIDSFNEVYAPPQEDEELVNISVKMNGTGNMEFEVKE